jgi:hypothetical protein
MDGAYGRETWQEFVAKSKPEQANPSCCLSYFAFQVAKLAPTDDWNIPVIFPIYDTTVAFSPF